MGLNLGKVFKLEPMRIEQFEARNVRCGAIRFSFTHAVRSARVDCSANYAVSDYAPHLTLRRHEAIETQEEARRGKDEQSVPLTSRRISVGRTHMGGRRLGRTNE
jgi:hypothetical protein